MFACQRQGWALGRTGQGPSRGWCGCSRGWETDCPPAHGWSCLGHRSGMQASGSGSLNDLLKVLWLVKAQKSGPGVSAEEGSCLEATGVHCAPPHPGLGPVHGGSGRSQQKLSLLLLVEVCTGGLGRGVPWAPSSCPAWGRARRTALCGGPGVLWAACCVPGQVPSFLASGSLGFSGCQRSLPFPPGTWPGFPAGA